MANICAKTDLELSTELFHVKFVLRESKGKSKNRKQTLLPTITFPDVSNNWKDGLRLSYVADYRTKSLLHTRLDIIMIYCKNLLFF